MRCQLQYVIFCSFLFIFYRFICNPSPIKGYEKGQNLLDPGLLALSLGIFTKFLYKNCIFLAPF